MRVTTAIALLITVLAVIGRGYPWISIPLALFAVCLFVWGYWRIGWR